MTAEFDWWLLIVGLVVGAGLVWLILAEWPRRDEELAADEVELEAGWIAAQLRGEGRGIEPAVAEAVLRQHRAYLKLPPPDEVPASASESPREVEVAAAVSDAVAPAGARPGGAPPETTASLASEAVGGAEPSATARHAASASAASVPSDAEAISTSNAITTPTPSDSATGQRNHSTR